MLSELADSLDGIHAADGLVKWWLGKAPTTSSYVKHS